MQEIKRELNAMAEKLTKGATYGEYEKNNKAVWLSDSNFKDSNYVI